MLVVVVSVAAGDLVVRHGAEMLPGAYAGTKNVPTAGGDTALHAAKREGKNRTVKAQSETANVFGGE